MKLTEHLGEWASTPLLDEFKKPYMKNIINTLRRDRKLFTVYPSSIDVFKAYRLTSLKNIKIVILGQDPYPHNSANGLCFSSNESLEKIPKSLQNIFKEIDNDIEYQPYHNPDLSRWAVQGVFLLNTVLTVKEKQLGSHASLGWKTFTKRTIELINEKPEPVVFLLWGAYAHKYNELISSPHHVIMSSHPSPLSAYRGFLGSKCFSKANEFLNINYNEQIDWIANGIE
jgi:uracil-DNA glycosylase